MAGGLISDEDIQKVREASDLVALFSERVPLKQRNREYWCCCPVHSEKSPSCKIDPSTQLWHCFGCGEGGDVFGFLMKVDGYTFPEAVEALAERAHIELTRTGKPQGASTNRKARLKAICAETASYYHNQLMRSRSSEAQEARSYLAGRNLGGAVPGAWNLGFAPGNGALVRNLSAKGFKPDEMVEANVAVADRGGKVRDRFYNRVMFPICDVQGDCIAFGGRIIGEGQPKYLNSNTTPLFSKSTVLYGLDKAKATMAATGVAIVVEGYTDVIALHGAGVTNAVATLGTALTRQHIRLLSRHARNQIVYLFDGDEAGQRAADRAIKFIDDSITPEAGRTRIELCAVTLPDNLDPADYVAARGGESLKQLISDAKPLLEYAIDRRLAQYDLTRPEGRATAFVNALSVLAPIKDSLLAKDYAHRIAERTRTRDEDANEQLARLKVPRDAGEEEGEEAEGAHPTNPACTAWQQHAAAALPAQEQSRQRFEREMLIVCAQNPRCALDYADTLAVTRWHDRSHELIAESMLDTLAENSAATPAQIIMNAQDVVPLAGGLLTGRYSGNKAEGQSEAESNVEAVASYLAEELALGDIEDSIEELKVRLGDPASMPAEEYEMLFETVVAMQKDLAARRMARKSF